MGNQTTNNLLDDQNPQLKQLLNRQNHFLNGIAIARNENNRENLKIYKELLNKTNQHIKTLSLVGVGNE